MKFSDIPDEARVSQTELTQSATRSYLLPRAHLAHNAL